MPYLKYHMVMYLMTGSTIVSQCHIRCLACYLVTKPSALPVRIDEALPLLYYRETVKHRNPDVSGAAAPPWVSDPCNPPNPERVLQCLSLCATPSVFSPLPRVAFHGCAVTLTWLTWALLVFAPVGFSGIYPRPVIRGVPHATGFAGGC